MRLDRLELIRYGKFTDQVVDFGPAPATGDVDLHVIIGANEAGKSTLFAAWRDLLYGIEQRSRYAFLHNYAAMRLGALVTIGGEARRFFRVKAGLRDGLDQAIADSAILAELGGIDRDGLTTMFSLDDDTLEKGGEAILKAKGELGQLLFAGASGLSELTQRLDAAEARAHEYIKRGGILADLAARAKDLAEERKRIDIRADQFHALRDELDQAQTRFDQVSARLLASKARAEAIDRLERARPRLAEWDDLIARRAPLEHWPAAPVAWVAEVARLREGEIELAARIATHKDRLASLRAAIAALPLDAAAAELDQPFRQMRDRYAGWTRRAQERPALDLRAREAEAKLAAIMADLGADSAAASGMIVGDDRIARLRGLVDERVRLDAALTAARAERQAAETAWQQLAPVADDPVAAQTRATDLGVLAQAVAAWRDPAHQGRGQRAAERADQAGRALDRAVAALAPWRGSGTELALLVPPPLEPLRQAAAAADQAMREIADLERRAGQSDAEADRLWAVIDAAAAVPGLIDETQAAQSRATRDAAWAAHLDRLDRASADRFAAALRHDDDVVARQMTQMAELARLRQDRLALVRARGEAQALRRQAADLGRQAEAQHQRVRAAIAQVSPLLPVDWDTARLELWLDHRANAVECARTLDDAQVELDRAQADTARRHADLAAALRPFMAVADDAGAAWLIAAAQAVQDGEAHAAGQRDMMAAAARRRDDATRALAAQDADQDRWAGAWAVAAAGLDLAGDPPSLSARLDLLARLEPTLRQRDDLAERLGDLEAEGTHIRSELTALAARLDMADPSLPDLVDAMAVRIDRAVEAARQRAAETLRLDQETAHGAALAAQEQALAQRQAEMLAHFGVSTLGQVQVALEDLARRADLDQRIAALGPALLGDLGVPDLAAARAALAAADWPALAAERLDLDQAVAEADSDRLDAHQALTRAQDDLRAVGGDDAAARLDEQRRTVLTELAEEARAAFALRAGLSATRAALKLYRERHRSALLARAGDAFATITRGAYRGLATQADKNGEVLVALTGAGGSKLAADLSKGTRFQLYLALRVAGYLDFVTARPPIPFVADDIMESFDDDRAAETFRLLGQMAGHGQVIYLTHHRHLADIARDICPGTRLHRLD